MPGITPFKPVGIGGDTTAYNVIKISFSQALSDRPILTAYDDYTLSTNNNTLFAGTAGSGNHPLIAAVSGQSGTTAYPALSGSPSGWFPSGPSGSGNTGQGTPNYLDGSTDGIYLSDSTNIPGVGGAVTFNLAYKFWSDLTTLDTMDGVIVCVYQYTGALPTVTFSGNSGTEGVPVWTPLVPYAGGASPVSGDTTQIRPCDTGKGATGDATYRQTIPSAGAVFPQEIWAKNF